MIFQNKSCVGTKICVWQIAIATEGQGSSNLDSGHKFCPFEYCQHEMVAHDGQVLHKQTPCVLR
jgi:hypothetical protein